MSDNRPQIRFNPGGFEYTEGIKAALSEYLDVIGKDIVLNNEHRKAFPVESLNKEVFSIFFYSSNEESRDYSYQKVFGFEMGGGQSDGISPVGTLFGIQDDERVVAELCPHALYILFDLPHKSLNQKEVLSCIMEKVVAALKDFRENNSFRYTPRFFIRNKSDACGHWNSLFNSIEDLIKRKYPEKLETFSFEFYGRDRRLENTERDNTLVRLISGKVVDAVPVFEDQNVSFFVYGNNIDVAYPGCVENNQIASISSFLESVFLGGMDIDAMRKDMERLQKERGIETMKRIALERINTQKRELENRFSSIKDEFNETKKHLISLMREQQMLIPAIKGYEAMETERLEDIELEIRNLFDMPQVVSAQFLGDNKFVVKTDMIFIDHDGRRYEIGKFEITLFLGKNDESGIVYFNNLTRRIDTPAFKRAHHPHINENGIPCLGNIQQPLIDSLSRYEFAIATILCMRYLQSVNIEDSAGQYIGAWPSAPIPEEDSVS